MEQKNLGKFVHTATTKSDRMEYLGTEVVKKEKKGMRNATIASPPRFVHKPVSVVTDTSGVK